MHDLTLRVREFTRKQRHFSYHKSIVSGQLFLKQHHFPKRNKKGRKFREASRRKANRLAFAISKTNRNKRLARTIDLIVKRRSRTNFKSMTLFDCLHDLHLGFRRFELDWLDPIRHDKTKVQMFQSRLNPNLGLNWLNLRINFNPKFVVF